MDSDIYLKGRFDKFLNNSFISFNEYHPDICQTDPLSNYVDEQGFRKIQNTAIPGFGIQAAFLAAEKSNPFTKQLLDYYSDKHFILSDGNFNMSIIAPAIYAMTAEKIGYRYKDEEQNLNYGVTIHESKFMASSPKENSTNAFGIHCCTHSWFSYPLKTRIKLKIKKILSSLGVLK